MRKSAFLFLVPLAGFVLLLGCGDDDNGRPTSVPLNPAPALTIGIQQQRPARVVLPEDYSIERRYPLVILLHGFGADATTQDFIFHLASRATRYQFILVLPDGTQNSLGQRFWDATPECCNFGNTRVDDVGYLAALMKDAMAIYAVDPQRIRLVGHSNGGYMSYRYICEHPVAVDRIVVLAGSTYLQAESCREPLPVDILHIHGSADQTILYEPNLPPQRDTTRLATIGAEAAVGRWAGVAHCADEPVLIERRDYHRRILVDGDPAETEILRYPDCSAGRSIELWRTVGGDHIFLTVNESWRDDVAAFLSE